VGASERFEFMAYLWAPAYWTSCLFMDFVIKCETVAYLWA